MDRAAAFLLAAVLASACATTAVGGSTVQTCRASADCAAGYGCQFAVYGSCGSPGSCIANADATACVPQTACGCDGATHAICLVNGNATSPIASLGSCDGAVQQGFDAAVADATGPSVPDASDAQVPPGNDAAVGVDTGVDATPAVDAADANVASTLGTPCSVNTDCTDPYFNVCHTVSGTKICTTTCLGNVDCRPPATAICNGSGYCQP